jgi:hypothetical protein
VIPKNISLQLLIAVTCFFLHALTGASLFAKTRKHIVAYGGIADRHVGSIAKNADILIVGDIRHNQIEQMKQINPKLIILKYHNAIGIHKNISEWDKINQNETWFVHDKIESNRLIRRTWGWYLMNNSNESWRMFLSNMIAKKTDDSVDGVFIDDFWDRFYSNFTQEGKKVSALPKENVISAWGNNMILFLKQLRKVYPKLIFINGAFEKYIEYVDGCMEEAFVHSSSNSDSFFHNSAHFIRSLKKIENLKRHGKLILLQSGTNGDGTGNIVKLFHYCYASYHLVCSKNTSFNFQPRGGYYFRGVPYYDNYKLDLGDSKGKYYVCKEGKDNPNLISNGNFNNGMDSWRVKCGNPSVDLEVSISGKSILFQSQGDNPDMIESEYIPTESNKNYIISVWCKADNNKPGSAGYRKLCLLGRFYDKDKQKLPGFYDLQFDRGTYDWCPFETNYKSPGEAAYFRLRLGFIGDGSGKGWVDDVYFGLTVKKGKVIRRDFSNGIVLVNCGTKNTLIELSDDSKENGHKKEVNIGAREGKILMKKSPSKALNNYLK